MGRIVQLVSVAVGLLLAAYLTFDVSRINREAPFPSSAAHKPPGNQRRLVIAYSGFAPSVDYWATLYRGIQGWAKRRNHVVLNLSGESKRSDDQVKALRAAMDRGIDGVILGVTPSGVESILDEAQRRGVPVVVVDNPIEHPWVSADVWCDSHEAATRVGGGPGFTAHLGDRAGRCIDRG